MIVTPATERSFANREQSGRKCQKPEDIDRMRKRVRGDHRIDDGIQFGCEIAADERCKRLPETRKSFRFFVI
jgi:hypothetical protein